MKTKTTQVFCANCSSKLDIEENMPAGDIWVDACETCTTNAYDGGNSEGHCEGYDNGMEDGMKDGLQEGYEEGYAKGYEMAFIRSSKIKEIK
jgi:flagellar biosynthesis/type III secretory pathway protein FliH